MLSPFPSLPTVCIAPLRSFASNPSRGRPYYTNKESYIPIYSALLNLEMMLCVPSDAVYDLKVFNGKSVPRRRGTRTFPTSSTRHMRHNIIT